MVSGCLLGVLTGHRRLLGSPGRVKRGCVMNILLVVCAMGSRLLVVCLCLSVYVCVVKADPLILSGVARVSSWLLCVVTVDVRSIRMLRLVSVRRCIGFLSVNVVVRVLGVGLTILIRLALWRIC